MGVAEFEGDGPDSPNRLRFRQLRADPPAFHLALAIAAERKSSLSAMLRRSRGSERDAGARQLAMYLAHVTLGRPQDSVAGLFRRDRTTVAHACQKMEDLRDEPRFEAEISRIEARCAQIARRQPERYHVR